MMRLTNNILLSLVSGLALTLGGCKDNTPTTSPTQRIHEATETLDATLRSAPNGWVMTYFPTADSLLFSSPSRKYGIHEYRGLHGVGGRYYALTFSHQGVQLLTDESEEAIIQPHVSQYKVHHSTAVMLSFTTYTALHKLVNHHFGGSSDFIHQGYNASGALVFTTPSYREPGHEFVRLEPLSAEDSPKQALGRALSYRKVFEQMVNPQIIIRYGVREYFRSNYYHKRRVGTNLAFINQSIADRYYTFLFSAQPGEETYSSFKGFGILGSGYTGTKDGLMFFPGIKYNSSIHFRDFEYKDGHFVAELVSVYDPILRKSRLESRHLYPQGIETGYTAEIWDAGHK